MKLVVGALTPRDDGRFYIPLVVMEPRDTSPILARVASDAFGGDAEAATAFAQQLADCYNAFHG